MTEAEYWTDYHVIENEVATAIDTFYAHLAMNNYATEDPACFADLVMLPHSGWPR